MSKQSAELVRERFKNRAQEPVKVSGKTKLTPKKRGTTPPNNGLGGLKN